MSQLISELKADHHRIIMVLGQVRSLGAASRQGHQALLSARDQLLSHLKKEDVQLYPVLRRAAIKDQNTRRMVDYFSRDMETIAPLVMDFFTRYATSAGGPEFNADFDRFFTLLMGRIQKEETVLFEAFDRL